MKIAKFIVLVLACLTVLARAQQPENPYLRAAREQQERQAERQRQQEEANRQYVEQLKQQREERLQAQRDADERAKAEADRINEANQKRREDRERPEKTERVPQVVQRHFLRTEQRASHGGEAQTYTVKIYKVVYDNGTSEEVEE